MKQSFFRNGLGPAPTHKSIPERIPCSLSRPLDRSSFGQRSVLSPLQSIPVSSASGPWAPMAARSCSYKRKTQNPKPENPEGKGGRQSKAGRFAYPNPEPTGVPSIDRRTRRTQFEAQRRSRRISWHEPGRCKRQSTIETISQAQGRYLPQLRSQGRGGRPALADSTPRHIRAIQEENRLGIEPLAFLMHKCLKAPVSCTFMCLSRRQPQADTSLHLRLRARSWICSRASVRRKKATSEDLRKSLTKV